MSVSKSLIKIKVTLGKKVSFITGMLEERENTGDYSRFEKEVFDKFFQDTLLARRIKLKVQRLG